MKLTPNSFHSAPILLFFVFSDIANHHWLFANRPGHDFMRQNHGKLSFYDTMRLIIGMGKGNTNDEIMDCFDLDSDCIPSQSVFNQRRSQISLSAFEYLFSEFSSAFPATTNTFKDFLPIKQYRKLKRRSIV